MGVSVNVNNNRREDESTTDPYISATTQLETTEGGNIRERVIMPTDRIRKRVGYIPAEMEHMRPVARSPPTVLLATETTIVGLLENRGLVLSGHSPRICPTWT